MKPILAGCVIAALGCLAGAQQGLVREGQQTLVNHGSKDELAFTQLEVGSNSPITEQGVTTIASEEEFKSYLEKIKDTDIKRQPIDWTKYQVLAVHMTGMSNDGFGLRVKRIHLTSAGNYDIEFTIGGSQSVPALNPINPNLVKKTQYPFALIETPITKAKWKVAVVEEADREKSR